MDLNRLSAWKKLLFPAVLVGILFSTILPADVVSMEGPRPDDWQDIQMIGIISPAGSPNLWAVSTSGGGNVLGLLAEHPSDVKDGIRFYRLSSWRDMADVLTALNDHQTRIIRQLAQDLNKLNNRVNRIERKRRMMVNAQPFDYRLKRLEEKVDDMLDGGNP